MRVLIAHADGGVRRRVADILSPLGYRVEEQAGAVGARAAVQASGFQVVLVAADLCADQGASLVTDIKRGPHGHSTAVILVSRDLDFDHAVAQLRRGAHDFVLEPVNAGELVARVQAAVRVVSLQQELLAQTKRMESLVYEDPLTGIHNRRFMLVQLGALISGARRHGRPVSVVMLDIDHFKAVNDTHGHAAGDEVLVAVSRALRDRLRAEDYLGRMGGEEFLALLPDTGEHAAARVAESLRRCAGEVQVHASTGATVTVTTSAGWATWAGDTPEELVRRADRALYHAKAAGRDLVRRG